MCDIDGETSTIFNKRWRKARKLHRCDECFGPIPSGVRYLEIGSLYDGSWETIRMHQECVELWDFVADALCGHRGYMQVGGLYDELLELEEALTYTHEADDGAMTEMRPELRPLLGEIRDAYRAMVTPTE